VYAVLVFFAALLPNTTLEAVYSGTEVLLLVVQLVVALVLMGHGAVIVEIMVAV
jgi:hypothetical protein